MKTTVDVTNRKEGALIRRGLTDPETRAFVKLMGALLPLKSDRARRRVLQFVSDGLAERREQAAPETV